MLASCGTVERSNSIMGFLHTKLRNRLSDEKVIKLTYIKFNAATAFKDFDPAIIAKALEEEEVEQEEQDDDGDSVVSINSGGK